GAEGEFMRCQALNLEQEIRTIAADGAGTSLAKAWGIAVRRLRARAGNGSLEALDECLEQIQDAFWFNGQVIGCNAAMPMALIRQAGAIEQRAKAHVSRKRGDGVILRLENILGAGIKKSEETLLPENLKGSVGSSFESTFDFEAMSRILTPASPRDQLPEDRRQRIRSVLLVLKSQRFFRTAKWSDKKGHKIAPYSFLYHNATSALRVIRDRVPDMVELTKAISIAELEIANRYEAPKHDAFFAAFDETSLLPEDMAFFPTYLIGLDGDHHDPAEMARILELLSSGIPVKILLQTDDILGGLMGSEGHLPFGDMSWQLANMAVGLNNVFALQTGGANLYRMHDKVWDGLTYSGAALFSVFSGGNGSESGISPYLMSAAATESRAFPTFSYDPSMGPDWASRLSIDGNPQQEKDWPIHDFFYEDEDLQRLSEKIVFTFIEFAGGDKRFSGYFARVPRGEWTDAMVPAGKYLEMVSGDESKAVPYVLMADENHMLHRLVIDDRLIRAARRCRDMWHSLQEMGGIHNSHALKLLNSERKIWQTEKDQELAELGSRPEPDSAAMVIEEKSIISKPAAPDEAEEVPEVAFDDPFIETPRCTTCNECTDINSQMFAYNDNKQAYIADPTAGTYRQLVEAAENCQVSIIHPGKPKDMGEPNLEELVKRAELFN
ncbi:MAG: ferredoxin, partial [Rhodospirillaceae bacterium]|nr:ferredoxin [Rhodospirillaceae bacterium]